MVEVGVGEQDEIDFWELPDGESRRDEAFGAEGSEDEIDAAARAEDGVGEDGEAVNPDESCRVSKPGGMEAFGLPGGRLGMEYGVCDGSEEFFGELPPEVWRLTIDGVRAEAECASRDGLEDGAATNSQSVLPSRGRRACDSRCAPKSRRGLRRGVRVRRAIWRSSMRRAGGR